MVELAMSQSINPLDGGEQSTLPMQHEARAGGLLLEDATNLAPLSPSENLHYHSDMHPPLLL